MIRFLPRPAVRLVAAAVSTACIAGGWLAQPATAAQDDGVRSATTTLDDARTRAESVRESLDEAAASYEEANAHRLRIADEAAGVDSTLAAVDQAVEAAKQELDEQLANAYKHPGGDNGVTDAILLAPDAGSALHRAAMFRRIAVRSAEGVTRVQQSADLTRSDVRQVQVVASGAQASAAAWDEQADQLESALEQAQRDVRNAEQQVASAREEARRRAAAEAAAEAARQAAAAAGPAYTNTVPPPAVAGKTCPVGTPNGFIDSWGFPRSGGRTHEGVDMFAPYGTPLYAVADGYIYRSYTNPLGGLAINLIDEAGNMYYYAHMSATYVVSGQEVRMGDVIGAVGTSGNAAGTPPHVHWQYHPGNGAPINPFPLAYALCRA